MFSEILTGNPKSHLSQFFSKVVSLAAFLSVLYVLVAYFNLKFNADGLIETSVGMYFV